MCHAWNNEDVINAVGTEWVTPGILRLQKRLFLKNMDKFVDILFPGHTFTDHLAGTTTD